MKSEPYVILDAGLRTIQTKGIIGTVDKCGELDELFRYVKRKDRVERSRRMNMEHAVQNYLFLPPIDVFKYRGSYYVVDGNRRVALAKAEKMEFMDANVKEYIHRSETEMLSGAMLRRRFEIETGLRNISLAHETGYATLLDEVAKYPGRDMEEKGKNWYSDVFLPACRQISHSELPSVYSGLSDGDLFVLIVGFFNEFMGGMPVEGFHTLISAFMFAHTLPEQRTWRTLPFRCIGRLLRRGVTKPELRE